MHDRLRRQDGEKITLNSLALPHSELTSSIISCSLDVMNELGAGFLESVYKNALFIALQQKKFTIGIEQSFEIYLEDRKSGFTKPTL